MPTRRAMATRLPSTHLTDETAVERLTWSTGDDFTQTYFGPGFPTRRAAQHAWERLRRRIWSTQPRMTIPHPAETFDGLRLSARDAVLWAWQADPFPLAHVLDALKADAAALANFERRHPRAAKQIADYLDLLRDDLAVVERTARSLAAWRGKPRSYPAHLNTGRTYGTTEENDVN